jgi:predicted Zn-ribbon and HTH transcriptional regulator
VVFWVKERDVDMVRRKNLLAAIMLGVVALSGNLAAMKKEQTPEQKKIARFLKACFQESLYLYLRDLDGSSFFDSILPPGGVDARYAEGGPTGLMLAALHGNLGNVSFLLGKMANPLQEDLNNKTALDYAYDGIKQNGENVGNQLKIINAIFKHGLSTNKEAYSVARKKLLERAKQDVANNASIKKVIDFLNGKRAWLDWVTYRCGDCGYKSENPIKNKCPKCGHSFQEHAFQLNLAPSYFEEEKVAEPVQWACSACTYLNQPKANVCEMCGTKKQ